MKTRVAGHQAEGAADLLDTVRARDVPFKTDRMASRGRPLLIAGRYWDWPLFHEPTPDRLREIDGRRAGKHTASQDELALDRTWA